MDKSYSDELWTLIKKESEELIFIVKTKDNYMYNYLTWWRVIVFCMAVKIDIRKKGNSG